MIVEGKKSENRAELSPHAKYDQYFYGRGKLLLSGEYFILSGAQGLALPTVLGQSLGVRYEPSFNPRLIWKSYDSDGNLWFESEFDLWHFKPLEENPTVEALELQKILNQARVQNKHFLRDDGTIYVETRLDFPLKWGLGSSSTIIYNIAQWAYISPFELFFKTQSGSGYDIACAQSDGPILYDKLNGPNWSLIDFSPNYKENLYFVYLGQKQKSREGIDYYNNLKIDKELEANTITKMTNQILQAKTLEEFEIIIRKHEEIISHLLGFESLKKSQFSDYWGEIKSLGAWGGDFALVTSNRGLEITREYFLSKGLQTVLPYKYLILERTQCDMTQKDIEIVH